MCRIIQTGYKNLKEQEVFSKSPNTVVQHQHAFHFPMWLWDTTNEKPWNRCLRAASKSTKHEIEILYY